MMKNIIILFVLSILSMDILPAVSAATPPTNVQVSQGTYPTTINITWDAVVGAVSYEIRRNIPKDYSTASVIASAVTQTSYDDSVTANDVYWYWIIALDDQGQSSPSTPVSGYRDFDKFGNCDSDSVTDGILKDQCEALVSLYDSTDGPNWSTHSYDNWKVTSQPCRWNGVSCQDGYVTSLSLSQRKLVGVIPDLSALIHLKNLELWRNKLSGVIPTSLNTLTNLETLYLRDNLLTGSIPDLSALVKLRYLHLQDNKLSGSIPDLSLISLNQLYLNNNQLNGTIPDLSNLADLRELHLENNQLSGSIPALPSKLSTINLQNNQLSGEIPASLGTFRLNHLYLNDNKLCGEIPPSLVNLNSVLLKLDNNLLIATDPTLIKWLNEENPGWEKTQTPSSSCQTEEPPPLPILSMQLTVSKEGTGTGKITGNGIDCGNDCTEVYEVAQDTSITLTATPSLDSMFVGWNEACSGTLATCQVTMNQDQTVIATFNVRSPETTDCATVTEISSAECESLLELYNSTNGANWKNNAGWNVTNTPCSWKGVDCLSGGVSKIDLRDNQLTGTIPNFTSLPNLEALWLYKNQLTGTIPDFSTLPKLKELWLHKNQLTGMIPNFTALPHLEKLYLYENQLTGTVPNFSALPNLELLYLEDNQLTGAIPNFSALPNLLKLVLKNNQLTGTIPDFNALSNLVQLSLASNQLTGTIPNFSALPNLETLSLSNNQLTGTIPNFSALPNLKGLYLSSNQLTGTIPDFSTLPNLEKLNLYNNQLTGTIADFSALPNLAQLLLQNNQLTGAIPGSNTFINLTYLDLRNNSLCKDININYSIWPFKQAGPKDDMTWQEQLKGFPNCAQSPTADFSISPQEGIAPLTVTLEASSNGMITDYVWTASNEQTTLTASGEKVTLTFDTEGSYTVVLTVTDNNGLTDTASQMVMVLKPELEIPTNQEALKAYLEGLPGAETVIFEENGLISATLNGDTHYGLLAESIVKGEPSSGLLIFDLAGDENGDGIFDFSITYPSGDQQILYYFATTKPFPANLEALQAFLEGLQGAETVSIEENGFISATLSGETHYGQLATQVVKVTPPADGLIVFAVVDDQNGDGINDFLITYPSGDQQVLHYFGTTDPTVPVISPVNTTTINTFATNVEFLYTGADARQQCVAEKAINPNRVALLRGKVTTAEGKPLSDVTVTVDSHLEYGYTLTDDKGEFTLAVDGSNSLTINYQKEGYMPTQREIRTVRLDYVWVNDVAMIPPGQGAGLNLTGNTSTTEPSVQTVQTPVSTDAEGSRQALVIFPPKTQATMTLSNCAIEALEGDLMVRATEYTVGDNGPQAMPLPLPPDSSYTYAIDLNIDQAIEAAARRIDFDQALPVYVDNFLGFEVGSIVPAGWYDRTQNAWIPSDNGRVVEILRVENNRAVLDVDGSGQAANAQNLAQLNITATELEQLATFYPNAVNKSQWRVLVNHFTPWDFNWPPVPPADAKEPPEEAQPTNPEEEMPEDRGCDDDCNCGDTTQREGCIIEAESQVLGESIPIAGTPFALHYRSDRVRGRKSAYILDIPLRDDEPLPNSLKRIELEISIAGQRIVKIFPKDTPDKSYQFVWDGQDVFGQFVQGQHQATVHLSYVYDGFYAVPADVAQSFGYVGEDKSTLIPAREEVKQTKKYTKTLGLWDARTVGFGGLTLNVHHTYDPKAEILYRGDGGQKPMKFTYSRKNSKLQEDDGSNGGSEPQPSQPPQPQPQPQTIELTDNDIRISHCTDNCGKVLIGSARVELNSIQWISPQTATRVYVSGYHDSFGFTGISSDFGNNQWQMFETDLIEINNPLSSGAAPSVGHFFAPTHSGSLKANNFVAATLTPLLNGNKSIELRGEGIIDNDKTPALTLDISIAGSQSPLQTPVDHAAQCVSSSTQGEITFTVTPRVNPTLLPADVTSVQHVIVELTASEKNTDCGLDGVSFADTILTAENFGTNDYFHILEKTSNASCQRHYTFLVSVDKPIQITASNQHLTQGGFVDYTFAIRGHYQKVNVAKWPNSHKSFHLVSVDNVRRTTRRSCPVTNPSNGEFNFKGQLASSDGGLLYIFEKGLHTQTLDSFTGQAIYTFGYNDSNYLISITNRDGDVTLIERNHANQAVAIVAPYGQRTTLSLDANGYLASVTNPANESHQLVYSSEGLLRQYQNPRGFSDKFEYNPLGLLVKNVNAIGGGWTVGRTDDEKGYTVTMTSGEGRVSHFQVENLGGGDIRRINTAPDGTTTEILKRNNYSGVTKTITRPDGTEIISKEGYDPRFANGTAQVSVPEQTVIKTPSGLTTTITTAKSVELTESYGTYDPSMLTKVTDWVTINERTSSSVYDIAAQTITATTAAGRQSVSFLNDKGRVIKAQTSGLAEVYYSYDERGRLTTLTEGEGAEARTITFGYGPQGNISTITDALNRQVRFFYDAADRVTSQTLVDGRELHYSYDANNNVTSITPPGRPAHHFAYNEQDLQTQYTPPSVAGVTTAQTSYEYNLDKKLAKIVRPDAQTIVFNYSAKTGRLDSVTLPNGQQKYAYETTSGNLASITAVDGATLSYVYDGSLPLSEAWDNGIIKGKLSLTYDNDFRVTATHVNEANTIHYQYDADSLLTQAGELTLTRDAQTGLLTATELGNLKTERTYNGFGEIINEIATDNGNLVYSSQYVYDKLGQITQKTETLEGVTSVYVYGYDDAGRLKTVSQDDVTTEQYRYDSNGNRLTATTVTQGTVNGSYDEQDRVTQYGDNHYTYTTNGELLTKTNNGAEIQYEYDVLGNLRSVQLSDNTRIDYVIDGRNRRIGKKVNGVLTQGFLYQGSLNPIAELDGNGKVVTVFVYGSKANVPDYMLKNGKTYRILSDHLGSPRLVIDINEGTIVQHMDYDAFGNVIEDSNPGFQPFGFAGGIYDVDTGLVRFGARDYDPEIGRWTAKDPILFDGGDSNLYGYVANAPINFIDSFGLSGWIGVIRPVPGSGVVTRPGTIPNNIDIVPPMSLPLDQPDEQCPNPKSKCPPCPDDLAPYSRTDIVPPSRPHYPCPGTHIHYYEPKYNQNHETCECFKDNNEVRVECVED